MADVKTVRVRIEGRVQGVWYRAWTQQQAENLGLNGWARNRPDGTVEALFSGPVETVDRMVAQCRDGPRLAKVTNVLETPADPPDDPGFHIHRDG